MTPPSAPPLDLLERLLAVATPGPWEWLDGDFENPDELQDGHGEMVATGFRDQFLRDSVTDGRLCAAARNALPELIAAARRAERLAEVATDYLLNDGSGIGRTDRWAGPFDAMLLTDARDALRAALEQQP